MKNKEIIYGLHAVEKLLKISSKRVERLYIQEDRKDQKVKKLLKLAEQDKVLCEFVTTKVLDDFAGRDKRHQGVLALCAAPSSTGVLTEHDLYDRVRDSDQPLTFLFLDGIQDPHNLGACLRSANAFGVTAVVIPKDRAAKLTDVAKKVACGAAEYTPVVTVTNFHRVIAHMQELGVWFVGLDGDAKEPLNAFDLSGHRAVVMGSEGQGMRKLTKQACDYLGCIPMRGVVESLNVSVATGIALYTVTRGEAPI